MKLLKSVLPKLFSIKKRPKNTTQSISIRANVRIAEIFTSILKETPSCLTFLADFGLNFNSVEEILSRDLGNDSDSLIHHEAYYVVCGRIEGNDVEFEKFGVKISFLKEASVPGDRQGEYFFIAIENDFPFIIDEERDFPTREFKTPWNRKLKGVMSI